MHSKAQAGRNHCCGGAPLSVCGPRWSAILYRPPYGLTGWAKRQTGQEVVLRTVTLHFPTNMPPPLHSGVIIYIRSISGVPPSPISLRQSSPPEQWTSRGVTDVTAKLLKFANRVEARLFILDTL